MSERSGSNPEHAKAAMKDWGQAIFGDQPFHYEGVRGHLTNAFRAIYGIPVGELDYENYGVPYQPTLSIEERLHYDPFGNELSLPRRLARRVLIPDEQKRLLVQARAIEPESRFIRATYRALAVTTGQVSGYYKGLEFSVSSPWTSGHYDPEFCCGLLYDDIPSPKAKAERLENYKQELTGIAHAKDTQIMDALAALATRSENFTQ